jgi:NAD(P)H-hydrate epimerase
LDESVLERIGRLLEGKRAVALGPGLSTAIGASALAMKLLGSAEVPLVVDADGINVLADAGSGAGGMKAPWVLTPHPGEMARLMKMTVKEVQADRIGVTREAAKRFDAQVVLKGANTVVAAPDGRVFVNSTGNAGMASGGMGDVLTGIVGGLLAQGLEPLDAALLGVFLHGLAGDRVAVTKGLPGLVASDIIAELPRILMEWTK